MRPRLGKAAWRAAAGGPSRRGERAAPRSRTVQLPAQRARRHRREAPAPRADPPAPLTWQRRPSRRRQVRPATQRAQDAQTASAATLLRARALRAQPRRRRPAETASCPPRSAHRQPNRVSAQRKRRFQCALCSRVAPLRPSCASRSAPAAGGARLPDGDARGVEAVGPPAQQVVPKAVCQSIAAFGGAHRLAQSEEARGRVARRAGVTHSCGAREREGIASAPRVKSSNAQARLQSVALQRCAPTVAPSSSAASAGGEARVPAGGGGGGRTRAAAHGAPSLASSPPSAASSAVKATSSAGTPCRCRGCAGAPNVSVCDARAQKARSVSIEP